MIGSPDSDDVLDDVFSSGRDRGADSAAPDSKEDAKPDTPPAEADAKVDAEADDKESSKQYRDPETGRFVPLHELKTERTKRQEEARLREEAEKRAAQYEQELQAIRTAALLQQQIQRQQYAAPPQAVEPPDPFTDPQAYQQFVVEQARTTALNERYNTSQMLAEEKYGAEAVNAALEEAARTGAVRHFLNATHPYGKLVEWHKKQQSFARVGDDVDGFEKRIREEERSKVLAELKQGKAPQRFPGTLADATASGVQGAILTDEAMMSDVFGSDRRTRVRR